MKIFKYNFDLCLPWHDARLHGLASWAPCSLRRQGPVQVRDRSISPSPQVVLQADHEPQCDQPICNWFPYMSWAKNFTLILQMDIIVQELNHSFKLYKINGELYNTNFHFLFRSSSCHHRLRGLLYIKVGLWLQGLMGRAPLMLLVGPIDFSPLLFL